MYSKTVLLNVRTILYDAVTTRIEHKMSLYSPWQHQTVLKQGFLCLNHAYLQLPS